MIHRILCCILALCAILVSQPALSADSGDAPAIEAQADKVLRQMSDYLNTLEQFTVHAENSVDTILASGQKLQLGRAVDVFVRRPNRFRGNLRGDVRHQELYYDGKTITLFGKKVNYYATLDAPGNIEAALDHAIESFGLVAPLADLIYRNSYDILTENVQYGFYAGLSTVHGVECHHLAFRGDEIDWQVWIENSETPLPKKFVITTKWVTGAPQFTALFSNWNVSPQLKDSLFRFIAPDNAERIEFFPTKGLVRPKKKTN